MKIVVFIHPPQGEVIEKILRGHRRAAMVGGLWRESAARPPADVAGLVHDLDDCFSDSQSGDLTFVDMATFEATF